MPKPSQSSRISFDWKLGPHERFAEDVQLPAPGSPTKFQGRPATIVSATRVDDETVRVVIDVPAKNQEEAPDA